MMPLCEAGSADPGAQSGKEVHTSVEAPDFHLLVQPSRGRVGSAEPPCRLLGTGSFECQLQFLSGYPSERAPPHNE